MTYPPPPGAPGDPQNPPPDPYAQPGGFGGPPPDPYAAPGGFGGPPPDPYGAPQQPGYAPQQPGPHDPYTAPPGDPYGQNPYSAPPASGPPGQPPMGDPYGGGFMPPGPPPRKSSNIGWIIGGVVGVVVIVAAVGGVIFFLNQNSGDDSAAGSDNSSSSEEGSDEQSEDSGDSGGGSDAQYAVGEGMCEELDYSVVQDAVEASDPAGGLVEDQRLYCSGEAPGNGFVAVETVTFEDAAAAESGLQDEKDTALMMEPKEASGAWDQGEVDMSEFGGSLVAQAGNAVIIVSIYPPEDEELDAKAGEDAAGALAENMMSVAGG